MSDLDDLARIVEHRMPVRVRRVGRPDPLPSARPRSAFAAGFAGTLGAIAALIVVLFVVELIRTGEAERQNPFNSPPPPGVTYPAPSNSAPSIFQSPPPGPGVWIKPYIRSDGTYVPGHYEQQ